MTDNINHPSHYTQAKYGECLVDEIGEEMLKKYVFQVEE